MLPVVARGQRLPRVAALMVAMLASVAAALWWWF